MREATSLMLERKEVNNTSVFSQTSWRTLHAMMTNHPYPAGATLFREGEPADKLYYVQQGQVRLIKTTAEGKEFALHLFNEGDLIGEVSGLNTLPHRYTAVVTESSLIGIISASQLDRLLRQEQSLAMEMLTWIIMLNQIIETKVRDLLLYGKPGALCSTLIRLANTYGEKIEQGWRIKIRLTHEELGQMIGATRESVNRLLRELAHKGVIAQDQGSLIIKDIDYLRQVCQCENCPVNICRL